MNDSLSDNLLVVKFYLVDFLLGLTFLLSIVWEEDGSMFITSSSRFVHFLRACVYVY